MTSILNSTLSVSEEKVITKAVERAMYRYIDDTGDNVDQLISSMIKIDVEVELKSEWNCIVGNKYGVTVNCDDNKYIQLFVNDTYNIFVYKSPTIKYNK